MIYIDVRTKEEFESGHRPGALNHPVELIMAGQMPEIPKNEAICVYCRSGARAGAAQQLMTQAGFMQVTNGGGINDVMR